MNIDNLIELNIDFVQYGVVVDPDQKLSEEINVSFPDLKWENGMWKYNEEFLPIRLVANLKIFRPESPDEPVQLNPTIKLRVYYTHDDLRNVIRSIKLAYWKGGWKVIGQPEDAKPLTGNQIWAGYFEIELDKWGDPPMALGN